ncbi:MAG TPA: hypothetical protein VF345_11215 [Chthoniobacterales bacterium]
MRTAVVILIAALLGCAFLVQKHHEHQTETALATAKQAATPRPVSEHNWAKHALDTTAKVTRQVAKQRQEDGVRK